MKSTMYSYSGVNSPNLEELGPWEMGADVGNTLPRADLCASVGGLLAWHITFPLSSHPPASNKPLANLQGLKVSLSPS